MAYGDIHNKTGTICRAQSDETCPLSTDGGHSADLDGYAEVHGVDAGTLRGLVENAKMAPKAALDLMGSGEMVDAPPAITKARYIPKEVREAEEKAFAEIFPEERKLTQERLVNLLGPIPEQSQRATETPQQRYERQMTQYKIDMVNYENQMLANYEAALAAHAASPFAPRPDAPPFRTVYPKSFEAYDQVPKDFLSDEIPAEIASQPAGAELWEEYLRKRKQLGDAAHARGDAPNRILYL